MKTRNIFPKLALAIVLASVHSAGVYAADFNGTATATVIVTLSISEDTVMNFGSLGAGPAGSTVVLDQADGVTPSGDVNIIGGGQLSGDFTITGDPSQSYTISYGPGQLDTSPASTPMNLTAINSNASGAIGGGGTESIIVGATLNVNGGQPAGSYSTAFGSPYTITINYP